MRLYQPLVLIWICALLPACTTLVDDSIIGRVVGVTDGDTIKVLVDKRELKIRLYGIDCPESKQAFGTRARQFTSALAFSKTVTVLPRGKDRYGRTLGTVMLPDGRNLNYAIVGNGFGWWYEQYAGKETQLKALQEKARKKRVGLWRDKDPVPPWEFRKR